jgi:hypothetical protein
MPSRFARLRRLMLRQGDEDSRRRRLLAIIALCVLLFAVTAGVAVWVNLVTSSHGHSFTDRMAEDTVIIAGGTLALALIAAVVAVMAFAVATGQPDLKLRVEFPFSLPNEPVFERVTDEEGAIQAKKFKQTTGTISVLNFSGYSAKNPSVVMHLIGMAFTSNDFSRDRGWVTIGFANTIGVVAVQWDGGATYSIHGHSTRQLPELDLESVRQIPEWAIPGVQEWAPTSGSWRTVHDPHLVFELLAEGYRRVVKVPVMFVEERSRIRRPARRNWL